MYKDIFREIASSAAQIAEEVMSLEQTEAMLETAEQMRDRYIILEDKIRSSEPLTKEDFFNLGIAATVVAEGVRKRAAAYEKAIDMYNNDIIPNLGEIIKASSDEEARVMAKEKFGI